MFTVLIRHTDFDSDFGADSLSTVEAHGPFNTEHEAEQYAIAAVESNRLLRTLITAIVGPVDWMKRKQPKSKVCPVCGDKQCETKSEQCGK